MRRRDLSLRWRIDKIRGADRRTDAYDLVANASHADIIVKARNEPAEDSFDFRPFFYRLERLNPKGQRLRQLCGRHRTFGGKHRDAGLRNGFGIGHGGPHEAARGETILVDGDFDLWRCGGAYRLWPTNPQYHRSRSHLAALCSVVESCTLDVRA